MTTPVFFIDFSYYVFYRYHALVTWWNFSQEDKFDPSTLTENQLFLDKFRDMCVENIGKVIKKYVPLFKKTNKHYTLFLARDCSRCDIWRHQHTDGYKAGREAGTHWNPYIFEYTYEVVVPAILQTYPGTLLSVETAEADDIIGVLVRSLRRESESRLIVVVTNDLDYLQLMHPSTVIVNLQGKRLEEKAPHPNPVVSKRIKILSGDKSDNIPSIFNKRTTKAKIAEYAQLPDTEFQSFIESLDEESKRRYHHNALLIDQDLIPLGLRQKIESLLI
jgi:5'-3' exonuclease